MEKTAYLIRNDGTLADVARHLNGKPVQLLRSTETMSLVRYAGPPPKDWWITNTMLERKDNAGT